MWQLSIVACWFQKNKQELEDTERGKKLSQEAKLLQFKVLPA